MALSSQVERGERAKALFVDNQRIIDAMTEPRDPLLVEREKTHGSFEDNAVLWRKLTTALNEHSESALPPVQSLALAMMALKLSRIMQQPSHKDHWDDIAGYAKLGAEACE